MRGKRMFWIRRCATFVLAGVSILDMTATVLADTHHVSPSGDHTPPFTNWPSAATNIQAAIDVAWSNDVVLVTNGVYDTGGVVVHGSITNRVAVTNAVTVRSVGGPQVTLIVGRGPSGRNAVRGVCLGDGARLEGFTVTNGHTDAAWHDAHDQVGGGVWCTTNSVVSNCIVRGNAAFLLGGGVYRGNVLACDVMDNEAEWYGGGAFNSAIHESLVRQDSELHRVPQSYFRIRSEL